MSITSEIQRIQNNIADTYTVISSKGGTLPVTQNSANLASAITSITGGGSSILYPHCIPTYDVATRTGNKIIYDNGIMSNFYADPYNQASVNRWLLGDKYFPNYVASPFTTFEFVITVKLANFNSDNMTAIFASSQEKHIFNVNILTNRTLEWEIGNGSKWYSFYVSTVNTIQLNTFYNVKLTYDGAKYAISVATDFTNYEEWGSVSSTDYLGKSLSASDNVRFQFGTNRDHNAAYNGVGLEIDLTKCYMKVDGNMYWQGISTITSTADFLALQGFNVTAS